MKSKLREGKSKNVWKETSEEAYAEVEARDDGSLDYGDGSVDDKNKDDNLRDILGIKLKIFIVWL